MYLVFVYYLFRQKAKKLWILFWQWLADWRMRTILRLSKKSCPWPTGTSPSWPSTWSTSCRLWSRTRPPQPRWSEPTSKNSEMISTTKCPRKGLPQMQVKDSKKVIINIKCVQKLSKKTFLEKMSTKTLLKFGCYLTFEFDFKS